MKSMAELEAIRQKTLERIDHAQGRCHERRARGGRHGHLRHRRGRTPVMLNAFMEEIAKRDLDQRDWSPRPGCIGMCQPGADGGRDICPARKR